MQRSRAWILATADYFPSVVEVLRADPAIEVAGIVTRAVFQPLASGIAGNVLSPSAAWKDELQRERYPCDLLLCFGFPTRVDSDILHSFTRGGFNFHPSFLPAYRGRQPIQAMVADQSPWAAMSVHRMTDSFDAGPIAVQLRAGLRRPYSEDHYLRAIGLLAPHALRAFLALFHTDLLGEVDQERATVP